jgi:hypothetical protein
MRTTIGNSRSAFTLFAVLASGFFTGSVQAQHFEYKEHHLGPTGLFGVTSPSFRHTLNLRQNHND